MTGSTMTCTDIASCSTPPCAPSGLALCLPGVRGGDQVALLLPPERVQEEEVGEDEVRDEEVREKNSLTGRPREGQREARFVGEATTKGGVGV
jgi:hypothetical protein